MGIDATAYLGYGFKVSGSLAEDIGMEEIKIQKGFDLIFSGSEGCEESNKIFVCIKKSCKSTTSYDVPKLINLVVQDDWDQQLKEYATVLGVKNPKIGWWLCSSLG